MAYDNKLALVPSGPQTVTFNGASFDLVTGTGLNPLVARQLVTAVSGILPTLNGKIQHSNDNATWDDLAFTNSLQVTAPGVAEIRFSTLRRYIRYVGTIGGTSPSFTMLVEISNGSEFVE